MRKLTIPYAQFQAKVTINFKNGIQTTSISYQQKGIAISLLTKSQKGCCVLKLSKAKYKIKTIL